MILDGKVDIYKAARGYKASQHMTNLLTPEGLKAHVRAATDFLKTYPNKYDSIAFTGLSGAVIAPIVALRMRKHLIAVRKSDDKDNHRGLPVEGYQESKRYIIIDDLVSSGATARRIQSEIKKFAPKAKCLGVLEVSNYAGRPRTVTELTEIKDRDVSYAG